MNSILDSMLNSKKIKYTVLDKLLKDYTNDQYKETSIYIDLNSVLSSFYNEKNLEHYTDLTVNDKYIFCSQILNIAGHFRHYFYSRKYMYTNIYFIYSTKQPKFPSLSVPKYKKELTKKYNKDHPNYFIINEIFRKNLDVVKLISKYIPHIYFIDSDTIDTYITPYHFMQKNNKPDNLNIIYTNDKMMFNYIHTVENTIVLTPKSDNSKIINSKNLMYTLLTKKYIEEEMVIPLDNDYFTGIQVVSGIKACGIPGMPGYGNIKTLKTVIKAYEENNVDGDFIITYFDDDELIDVYNIFNIDDHYRNAVFETNKDLYLDSMVIDLIDANTLLYINHEYLNHYPIYLEYLFEGEEYE